MNGVRYVVYVDHPADKAVVHSVDCGRFVHRKRDRALNGYWSTVEREPFETLDGAISYARKTGMKNVDTCVLCISRLEE